MVLLAPLSLETRCVKKSVSGPDVAVFFFLSVETRKALNPLRREKKAEIRKPIPGAFFPVL